jgi:imidazolonepropionase-like amidohydrolase
VIEGGWPIPVIRKEVENMPNGDEFVDAMISGWPKLRAASDAEPFVRQQMEQNHASYIKMFHELGDTLGMAMPRPPMDIQRAVARAAHQHGLIAVGHAFSHEGAMDLLEAGADGLTHIFLDRAPSDAFVRLMADRGAHCNPTLCLCASQTAEDESMQRDFTADPLAQRLLLKKDPTRALGLARNEKPRASVANAYESVRSLYRAGVPLIVGTDASGRELGVPYGLGMHMEMHLWAHEVGVTPEDILRSATSTTADRFGFHDRGRIAVGKRADLVLVQGDVVGAILDTRRRCLPLEGVWREGVMASVYET